RRLASSGPHWHNRISVRCEIPYFSRCFPFTATLLCALAERDGQRCCAYPPGSADRAALSACTVRASNLAVAPRRCAHLPGMKLYSWNVNGIRSLLSKGKFHPFLSAHQPDVLCLQETKAQR